MGRRTKAQKEGVKAEAEPQVAQIPIRSADIQVRSINLEAIMLTFISNQGMSVENYTVEVDQWRTIVENTQPWLDLPREASEAVNPIPRLVGPTGATLIQ